MTTPTTTTRLSRKGDRSNHECTCLTTNMNSLNSSANFDELKHCIEKCVENFTIKSSHKHPPIIVMLGLPPTTPTPTPTQSHLGSCQCKQIQTNVAHGSGSDYSMKSAKTSTPSATSSKFRSSSNHHHHHHHFTGLSRIETKPEPIESIYKLNETRESLERKKFTSSKDYVVIDNKNTNTNLNGGGRSKSASVYEKINSQIDKVLHMNNNNDNNNNKTYSTLTHVTPLAETLLSNVTQSTLINNNTNSQKMQRFESLENIYNLNEKQSVSSRREEQERLKSKMFLN